MPKQKRILGQPSWTVANTATQAAVTQTGGHVGPVSFQLGRKRISPLSVAPWAQETLAPGTPPIIRVLRGDFFCMPFGGNARPYRGEQHPVHGETANERWNPVEVTATSLRLRLQTKIRPGTVEKTVALRAGETFVYQRHTLTGMRGPMNFGHHAMLKFPDQAGSGLVAVCPFRHGQVFPEAFERAESYGYQSLRPGAVFRSLDEVPLANGGTTDLSRYPARRGYEDLVMVMTDPSLDLAWTAVTFPAEKYVWFSLRDPRVLTGTVLWISNGGRHYAPWNSRHVNVMGLEDITGCWHYGLAESAGKNPLTQRGFVTSLTLHPQRPLVVNYIFGIASVPAGFDHVAEIKPGKDGVELRSRSGKRARAKVDLTWLSSAE